MKKMMNLVERIFTNEFFKYILIGIINTIIGATIMFFSYDVLKFGYWVSSFLNYFIGSIFSFFLNKKFTFKNKARLKTTLVKFIINIVFCYLISYGLSKSLFSNLNYGLNINDIEKISLLLGMFIFVILNYIGQKYFVFKN